MKRKKLRNIRPKALFGEGVAAAGIQAAATLAAAGIQARQMATSAKEQAAAQMQGAQLQAQSIEQTNQNNNQLQQQSQEFIASENEANRQIQRDLQMNLQLLAGAQSAADRRAQSRIQVKKGGKVRRSNKGLRDASFPLRGSNIPFQVIDGGGVLPLGTTPEGYDLYEIVGNDHEHYHKTRKTYTKGSKYKSGVGIKFDNGQIVEGEGNQNSGQGELLLVTPDSGMFISKHSINGFNPAKAVDAGMHPLAAYQLQEASKFGTSSPVKGRYAAKNGTYIEPIIATGYPMQDIGFAMTGPNVGAALLRPALKRGGRVKAWSGLQSPYFRRTTTPYIYDPVNTVYNNNLNPSTAGLTPSNAGLIINPTLTGTGGVNPQTSGVSLTYNNNNNNRNKFLGISGNLWGAGLTTLGNLGGAWLTSWGANRASKYLSKAYTDSAELLAGAYDKLQGVDMSSLKREDFRGSHYMPAIRSSYVNVNPQLETTNREFRRLMRATNAGTLSSAVRLNRMANANAAAAEQRSSIYADKANREEEIKQKNIAMINEAAAKNAELDIQASRDFTSHYVDLLKYNNDIANERITGRAQAIADGMLGAAGARATAAQTSGQSWGNAISASGQAFGNAIATDAAQRYNLELARLGATRRGELSYLKRLGTDQEVYDEVMRLQSMLSNPDLSTEARENIQNELTYLTSGFYENTRDYSDYMRNYGLVGSVRRSIRNAKSNRK